MRVKYEIAIIVSNKIPLKILNEMTIKYIKQFQQQRGKN